MPVGRRYTDPGEANPGELASRRQNCRHRGFAGPCLLPGLFSVPAPAARFATGWAVGVSMGRSRSRGILVRSPGPSSADGSPPPSQRSVELLEAAREAILTAEMLAGELREYRQRLRHLVAESRQLRNNANRAT